MSNPVVLITGGLTGIGRAAALAFAKDGAKVVVSGRREAEGPALASELLATGAEAEFIGADVRFEDDVRNLGIEHRSVALGREFRQRAEFALTLARFGRLDVAVNSAGTWGRSSA